MRQYTASIVVFLSKKTKKKKECNFEMKWTIKMRNKLLKRSRVPRFRGKNFNYFLVFYKKKNRKNRKWKSVAFQHIFFFPFDLELSEICFSYRFINSIYSNWSFINWNRMGKQIIVFQFCHVCEQNWKK